MPEILGFDTVASELAHLLLCACARHVRGVCIRSERTQLRAAVWQVIDMVAVLDGVRDVGGES